MAEWSNAPDSKSGMTSTPRRAGAVLVGNPRLPLPFFDRFHQQFMSHGAVVVHEAVPGQGGSECREQAALERHQGRALRQEVAGYRG